MMRMIPMLQEAAEALQERNEALHTVAPGTRITTRKSEQWIEIATWAMCKYYTIKLWARQEVDKFLFILCHSIMFRLNVSFFSLSCSERINIFK